MNIFDKDLFTKKANIRLYSPRLNKIQTEHELQIFEHDITFKLHTKPKLLNARVRRTWKLKVFWKFKYHNFNYLKEKLRKLTIISIGIEKDGNDRNVIELSFTQYSSNIVNIYIIIVAAPFCV